MSDDTGKTIVSAELADVLEDVEQPIAPKTNALPWVTLKVTAKDGLSAEVSCCLMSLDERTASLSDVPIRSSVSLLRESIAKTVESVELVTELGTFTFSGSVIVSMSVLNSESAIVTLAQAANE